MEKLSLTLPTLPPTSFLFTQVKRLRSCCVFSKHILFTLEHTFSIPEVVGHILTEPQTQLLCRLFGKTISIGISSRLALPTLET